MKLSKGVGIIELVEGEGNERYFGGAGKNEGQDPGSDQGAPGLEGQAD